MKDYQLKGTVIALLLLASTTANAAGLSFSRHYGDNTVLQRGKPVTIRGLAAAGADVTVTFGDQSKQATADRQGAWSASLDPMPANRKGADLVVTDGKNRAAVKNVVVGDVFLFARQTSIDVSLSRDSKAIDVTADPDLRVLTIKTIPATLPQPDLEKDAVSGWKTLDENTALGMSAAAFYLAQELGERSDFPVGIIDLNMGHHFPISWLSREALLDESHGVSSKGMITKFDVDTKAYESGETQKTWDEHYKEHVARAEKSKQAVPEAAPVGPHPKHDPRYPAAGYNAVLYPIRGLTLKAALIQLGHNYPYMLYQKLVEEKMDLERARLGLAYKDTYDLRKWCIYLGPQTTPRIARQWRIGFGDMTLPIGLITPPASDLETMAQHHMETRELQRQVTLQESGVGLILPGIRHIPFSAQPADEALLAKRSLHWVLGAVYGQDDAVASGPVLERIEPNYSEVRVVFKSGTADGLRAAKGALDCFEVAGSDAEYSKAAARLEGKDVVLKSDSVNSIIHVRYNWRAKPDQGLVNSAGLPAVPFRTDDHTYPRTIKTEETDLPSEYTTPARDWQGGDVTIVNGALAKGNWGNGEGWLGVSGILVAPFGPNMAVLHVLPESPAGGKIMKGDLIYSVNGELIGDDPLKQVAAALRHAESEAGKGLIAFGLRRKGKNMDVRLKLEVLGSYSSTSPYDCPKTDRIVANMETWLAKRGGVSLGGRRGPFQSYDSLFLLAAGTPRYQGLVRRHVYNRMAMVDIHKRIDPLQTNHRKGWALAYDALLASEYYLATGDRNVLPFLKWNLDYLAMSQVKVEPRATPWPSALAGQSGGWRHNWYGGQGYGVIPAIGVPAYISYQLALEIGVETDYAALDRGVKYLKHNGVEFGSVFYGSRPTPKTTPNPIDPDKLRDGMLASNNGAISLAGVLFDIRGDAKIAHVCSMISTYAYNNTHKAHGGNFWSNCWTPLGAKVHGKKAFQTFMQGHAWYRDLHRMYDHSHMQGGGGLGGGQYLALVAPRERLRILGAEESVFAANPKEILWPALAAYRARDYAAAEALAGELLASGTLTGEDQDKVTQLSNMAKELQESIAYDLDKTERLIAEGKVYEASLELPQLKGVVAAEDPRLTSIVEQLEAPEIEKAMAADKKRYDALLASLALDIRIPEADETEESKWHCLTPQSDVATMRGEFGKAPESEAAKWRFKCVESVSQAPEGWTSPGFDDSTWGETTLPISWHVNHGALLRSSFDIKDKGDVAALRLRMYTFRQQDIKVYINGKLVAKVNKVGFNYVINETLSDGALKTLKKGKNTIAVTYKNNWRWGRYTKRFETAQVNSVYNNGVTVMLDMKKKE